MIRALRSFGYILSLIFSFLRKGAVWIIKKLISLFKKSTPIAVDIAPSYPSKEIPAQLIEKKFRFLPNFSIIKELFAQMTRKQKLYALGAILLIFIVPFFIVKIQKNISQKKLASQIQEIVPIKFPLENELNLTRLENLNLAVNFS